MIINVAVTVFAVIAVLFIICLAVFIKSYLGYRNDDNDYIEEEAPPRKKVKSKETAAASTPEPTKTGVKTTAATPKTEVEAEPKPVAEPPKKEVKAEPKPAAKPPKNEVKTQPAPAAEKQVKNDLDSFATRVSTKEEMALIREAERTSAASAPKPTPTPVPDSTQNRDDDEPRSSKLIPIVTITAAVIAVLCIGALVYTLVDFRRPAQEGDSIVTAAVTTEDIILQETITGKISSPENITSIFAATGSIDDVLVSEGDFVSKGDAIYVIDSSNLQARIDLLNERLDSINAQTKPETVSVTSSGTGVISRMTVSVGEEVEIGDTIAEINIAAEHSVTVTLNNHISTGDRVTVNLGSSSVQGSVASVRELHVNSSGNAENDDDDEDRDDEDDKDDEVSTWTAVISFTTTAEVGSTVTVTANGERASGSVTKGRSSTATITAKANGKISELRLRTGSSVSTGDVIAVIEKPVSASTASSSFDARELQLEIEQLSSELENYTLRASTDGYIEKLFLKKGENAVLNMSAVTLAPVDNLSLEIELSASVAENMTLPAAVSYKMQRNNDYSAEVWDKLDPNRIFHATIDSLTPSSGGDKYVGYIVLDDQSLFRSGMTAKVTVTTYSSYNAVVVPKDIVTDGKVKVLNASGEVEEVEVETGAETTNGKIEIKSGLSRADKIIIEQAEE